MPRDGRRDDEDVVLADLQRGPRLLVRRLRRSRPGLAHRRVLPGADRRRALHVDWTIEELGADAFEEGDVIVHNDPYRGGCHLPEHLLLKPVFHDGELRGVRRQPRAPDRDRRQGTGRRSPRDATDVYQEGLRLPPVKLMRRGERNEDVWRILLANHRTPRSTWGDLHAMIGSLERGRARVHELLERFGARRDRASVRRPARLLGAPHARRDRGDPGRRVTRSRT